MKKLVVLLGVISLSVLSYGGITKHLEDAVSRQVAAAQQEHSLYTVISTQLQQYYGRKNFEDKAHKTGWYRVQQFLDFVQANEAALANSRFHYFYVDAKTFIPKDYNYKVSDFVALNWAEQPDYLVQGFWSYLGVRYLAQLYPAQLNFSTFAMMGTSEHMDTGTLMGAMVVNTQEKLALPEAINAGIHEGTHMLPGFSGNHSGEMLNELATFYSEYNFSLPVKKEDASSFATGTRDVRRIHALRPELPIYREYNLFITGLILNPQLTPAEVLTLKDGDFNASLSLWEMVISLAAARNNRFMHHLPDHASNSSHFLPVTKDKLVETAAEFGFTPQDVQAWLVSPALIIDLGDGIWPGSPVSPKESVVLQKVQDKFYFVGNLQRVSEAEFMKLNFGPFANEPKLAAFYQKVFALLPEALKQTMAQRFPVIIEEHYTATYARELAVPYEAAWNKAIVQALQEVAPHHFSLPDGYL